MVASQWREGDSGGLGRDPPCDAIVHFGGGPSSVFVPNVPSPFRSCLLPVSLPLTAPSPVVVIIVPPPPPRAPPSPRRRLPVCPGGDLGRGQRGQQTVLAAPRRHSPTANPWGGDTHPPTPPTVPPSAPPWGGLWGWCGAGKGQLRSQRGGGN